MEEEIIKVDINTETISCDGGQDSLGHPAVYYTFNQSNQIVCLIITFQLRHRSIIDRVLNYFANC